VSSGIINLAYGTMPVNSASTAASGENGYEAFMDDAADSSGMKLDQISDLQCGDGWAAVGADVSSSSATADPDTGITITLVFEQEGQFWVPKDRTAVCGTPSTADPASRPDDAQVPASIWLAACNTN